RGDHAESQRLIEEAVQAFEHAGDRYQVGSMLTTMAVLACQRGEVWQALSPLREALRLARDTGSRERMVYILAAAIPVFWHRGRSREAASLLGVVDRSERSLRRAEWFRSRLGSVEAGVAAAGFDEQRIAGRGLRAYPTSDSTLDLLPA